MDAKKLERELERLVERSKQGTDGDFNAMMTRALTKFDVSPALVEGWLNAWLKKHINLSQFNLERDVLLIAISEDTPNSIIKAVKTIVDEKGLGKRTFYAPDKDMLYKLDKQGLKQYIEFLESEYEKLE